MVGFEPSPSEPLTTNPCRRPLPDFLPHAPSALICQTSAVNIKETLHQKHQNGGTHCSGLVLRFVRLVRMTELKLLTRKN